MAFGLGAPELIIILIILMIIFGVGRLADVASAIGRSVREFRAAVKDEEHGKE